MSIAQNLIDIIHEEIRNRHLNTLKSVRLRVGKMSAVVPDSLSFCFDLITKGTDFEEAELIIDIVPLMGFCNECTREFEIEGYAFQCPSCGSRKIETISGRELDIAEIEVD
jgi:hydrogenase nickel incorporation protein HypA/HybF